MVNEIGLSLLFTRNAQNKKIVKEMVKAKAVPKQPKKWISFEKVQM